VAKKKSKKTGGKKKPASRATRPVRAVAVKPRTLPIFHVDALTRRLFHGNPASVVLVEGSWLPDEQLQSIAIETNQPMTAFVQPGKGRKIGLRWFNAVREFDLCGHATLAAAHVLWNHVKLKGDSLTFDTLGGNVRVLRDGELIALELPAHPAVRVRATNALCAALGRQPTEVYQSGLIMAVFENKRDVHSLAPDMDLLAAIDTHGIIVTAPGAGHDFVSRYFAPRHGLDEDHATGSSHCTLVPYWSKRLGKQHLTSHQVSHRGGEMWCELKKDSVLLGGHAVTFGQGTVSVA
jgi:PhzF family phenazine biosynthesis protein